MKSIVARSFYVPLGALLAWLPPASPEPTPGTGRPAVALVTLAHNYDYLRTEVFRRLDEAHASPVRLGAVESDLTKAAEGAADPKARRNLLAVLGFARLRLADENLPQPDEKRRWEARAGEAFREILDTPALREPPMLRSVLPGAENVYTRQEKWEDALALNTALQKAVAADPEGWPMLPILVRRADLLASAGRADDAIEAMAAAVREGRGDGREPGLLARLAAMHTDPPDCSRDELAASYYERAAVVARRLVADPAPVEASFAMWAVPATLERLGQDAETYTGNARRCRERAAKSGCVAAAGSFVGLWYEAAYERMYERLSPRCQAKETREAFVARLRTLGDRGTRPSFVRYTAAKAGPARKRFDRAAPPGELERPVPVDLPVDFAQDGDPPYRSGTLRLLMAHYRDGWFVDAIEPGAAASGGAKAAGAKPK